VTLDITALEKAVLGSMMAGAVDQAAEVVSSGDFFDQRHQLVYAHLIGAWADGEPVEPTAIAHRLAKANQLGEVGGGAYLAELFEHAQPDVGYYAREVAAAAELRAGEVDAGRLTQIAQGGDLEKLRAYRAELVQRWTATPRLVESDPCLVDGGSFVFDTPATPPAVWGEDERVIWAQGEALMICGPAGVGKTTLAVQLVAARLGLETGALDVPVRPGRRVLYLAMDRPPQISRAMRRLFTADQRDFLADHLVVRKGPPPADFAKHPGTLAELCRQAAADTVVVDSIKDAALGLASDEVGAGYNNARQRALAAGVEVLELHHQRKASGDNKRPDKLADVYGSTWITAGAGSVLMLWGEAGDPIVDLSHLKQPMEPFGPVILAHDHIYGRTTIHHQADLLAATRYQGRVGMNARLAATMMFTTDKPTEAQLQKARRKLTALVRSGHLIMKEGIGQDPARYFLAAQDIDGREAA